MVSDSEELPDTEAQKPDGEAATDPSDADTEKPDAPEEAQNPDQQDALEAQEDAADGMLAPAAEEEQLQEMEMDASEYILQAGGTQILPEAEDGGIALFAAEDRVEDVIAAGLKERAASIDISSFGLTVDGLRAAYVHVLNENPSLFYVDSSWSYYSSGDRVTGIVPKYLSQYDESSSAKYEAAVNKALESINDQMDEVEKALALHDYLVLYCAYENDGQGNYQNYNAYNALLDGEAVCQGYTLAYTDLLQRAGISVSYATSDAMSHIWNLVQLRDNWYHVDTTWDDPTPDHTGRVGHNNFLRSDAGITATNHHDWVTGVDGVTCIDEQYASGQFWNDVSTAVFYEGNTCYYMSGTGQIRKRSGEGSEEEVYVLKNTRWPVWGSTTSFWQRMYTGLSRVGDYLYCNDKDSVYRIPLSSPETASVAYTYSKGDGYIYGSCVRGDKVHLAVAQDPNSIPARKVFTLSDKKIHTWNTIDGGTADSSAPEEGRMKLLVFAPVWFYSGMRHFYGNPLFRDNKYMDVVILDTQGEDVAQIQGHLPTYYMENYPNTPISYGYYKETNIKENDFYNAVEDFIDRDAYQAALEANNPILQAYQEYLTLAGRGEYTTDLGRWNVTCFLINSKNEVVYSDTQGQDYIDKLVENLVNEIHEKEYFHSDISASISFRKDEEGRARFEWEKNNEGLGQALIYKDVEEEKVRARDCECNFITDQGMLDEGYAQEEVTDAEGRIYYYQMVLLDQYGLEVAVSDVVHSQADTAPNPDYTWETIDGGTISSKNDPGKLKFIAFIPMKSRGSEMSAFYDTPLFHGKKYTDMVVLDSSGWSKSEIKNKVDAVEEEANRFQGIARRSSAMTYCYVDKTTSGVSVEDVFQAYCAKVGATIEFGPETVGYFQIDQKNQIVDYLIVTPERNPDDPVYRLPHSIQEQVVLGNYFTSDIPAPKVRITENKTGKIVLEWDKVAGAEGYRVERAYDWGEDDFFYLSECLASTTRYEDYVYADEQGENKICHYRIASQDSYGILGEWSESVTNKGMPPNFDPTYFKELYLVDEKGNRIESIDLHVGELKRVYLELERHNGQKVQIKSGEDATGAVEWEIVCAKINQGIEDGTETVYYMPDWEEKYATWWYEDLMNPLLGGVVGREAMDTEDMEPRYLYCSSSGSIGGVPYNFQIYVPIYVEEAEEGVTYPPIESPLKNCYTDREKLNQDIRDLMAKREKQIIFCVPWDTWEEWNWDMYRDVLDFYQDREGMKSWEGDYLQHAIQDQENGPINKVRYQGSCYKIYAIDVYYWDNGTQDQKVAEKLETLIWNPKGALYPYHNATEYEIIEACMKWIRSNVKYKGTTDPKYHSAYSALYNGYATCEGYSLLLYRMLREFGISNRILMGIDTNAHAYNLVEIDGKYYYTDPTSGAMLKGSDTFIPATLQDRYQWPEYVENVTSRISEKDYDKADAKLVRLYETADQEGKGQLVGSYKTLADAKAVMVSGRTYRMDLLSGVELKTPDELNFPEDIDCTLNLNGRTLTVPVFAGGAEVQINVNLYGGSNGTGSINVASGQSLYLGDASQNKPMMLRSVKVIGTSKITLGKNVTVDVASSIAAGELNIPAVSEHVVLDGTVTANTFTYKAADMVVSNLTVSGQTTIKGGSILSVKGSVVFGKVSVEDGIFNLNLIKTLSADGGTIRTGTATFKDVLEKAEGQDCAVEITRTKVTEGASGAGESDPFMLGNTLITITGNETAVPTGYFRIPKDPYGREISPVREGNVLKVKGVVVEVSLKGREEIKKSQKYISVDAAVAGIGTDFEGKKGTYQFTFLGNAVLTKNLTLPACVEKLELKAAQKEQGQLFATLNFQGFTFGTAASVTLYEGLELISVDKQAKLNLTGTYGEEAAFQMVLLSGDVTWIDALGKPAQKPERREWASRVEIAAPNGMVVLRAGEKASDVTDETQKLYLQDISAKGLSVEDGAWGLEQVTLTEKYQVAENAAVLQTNVTLTNAAARIDGLSEVEVDNLFTISNTRLLVGETGTLSGMLAVKSAYKNESAVNGYTVENQGRLLLSSLDMTDGTLYNSSIARIETVKNSKNLINDGAKALFITKNFNQNSKGKSSLRNGSVMAVGEKAVLCNTELGGAYFYQTAACSTALDGKNTVDAALPEKTAGLEFVQISGDSFQELWENPENGAGSLPVEEIVPQTCLFTTKEASFPTEYVSVRQQDSKSVYTKVYQMGINVRVGKEWIEILARKMDGEEEKLEGFILWSDAMNYLSNLSNPNMIYIVHILEDVDIEQGLTMPGKAAGLEIRGTEMPDGENKTRKSVLTYTGDLNLTMPLEFSGIELKAKKNSADYESTVKLNGMRLVFSDGASAVFSSVKGNASSVLVLNGESGIEVHGEVNVGQLWSDGKGTLTGLATVKRDKAGNITDVAPQITINGQTDIRNGTIQISLREKITVNKVTSYESINFFADEAAQIRREGMRMAKAPYAKPGDFVGYRVLKDSATNGGITQNLYAPAPMSKKDGYLVCFGELDPGVKLIYGVDDNQTEIPFRTFAEAVAEINGLKTKQSYTIQVQKSAAELSKESPAELTMPNKNYISDLRIEAVGTDSEVVELYYLGGLSLTSNTVLKNIAFKQMVKSGKDYVAVDEQAYPSPVSLKTGGFDLTIEGKVTFNAPLNLEGGNSGNFAIAPGASLVTVTNGIKEENLVSDPAESVIVGSIKKFKTFNVPAEQNISVPWYGTETKNGIKYTAAELNVTEMTICGSVLLDGGNVVVKDLVLDDGTLTATGASAGKVTLTNVTLKGGTFAEICADRDFTISGNLKNQTGNAQLTTRQKPSNKNVIQMPYLNITGKVTSEKGDRITVCVYPNDCKEETPVTLKNAPQASGQLLTAKTAGVEYFAVAPENLGADSEKGKGGLYSPENPKGYMLVKTKENIYVYGADQIAVALCEGDASDGDWSKAEILNYYPGWAEAVAAVNALNQTKDTYTFLLLKDAGTSAAPLKLTLPGKAAKVYVASVKNDAEDGQKGIYYQNALSLGTHTEFVNVTLHPVTNKGVDTSLGISTGNFDLALRDVEMGGTDDSRLKDISGKGKENVTLASKGLILAGGISGVKSLTVEKNATVLGAVKVEDLILVGTEEPEEPKPGMPPNASLDFSTEGAVTVTNVVAKGKRVRLNYGRTNKNFSNLTIKGDIRNEDGGILQLNMQCPFINGVYIFSDNYMLTLENSDVDQTILSDVKKLAEIPKASTSDFEFSINKDIESDKVVKANKGLYWIGDSRLANYTVELETVGKDGRVRKVHCLDYNQAVNEINNLSDGEAEYILNLPEENCVDTNLTDKNPYGPLTMPGNGKAAAVTLSGDTSTGYRTCLTFSGNISMSGHLTLKDLELNSVKGTSNGEIVDFNISVTGNAKSGGASLCLDNVQTGSDTVYWYDERPAYETGYINQITGTKNVTNVTIRNTNLRLKTGVSNVNVLTLDEAHMITCKTSTLNNLSISGATWDALGATIITNITHFDGADSYLAGKQDTKNLLSQLTVTGRVEALISEPIKIKVIDSNVLAEDVRAEIQYVDSYKDVVLLKAPKEAAGKFTAVWEDDKIGDWIYYKDTSNYVLCGDRNEMVVLLAGTESDGKKFAETYAKSWNDAVTIINNLNDPAASYTLELLQTQIFTEKNGTFGAMTFPANNKAASLVVRGTETGNQPVITFSGNLAAYGNVTLEGVTLRAMKNLEKQETADFSITADGARDASSLTLKDVQIDPAGGALKDIAGKSKASVILDSKGLVMSGGISATPHLTVQKDATVKGAVKADVLTLEASGKPVTFTTEGAVTVTDVENKGGQNTLSYSRTAKNATNLTVNGEIINERAADGTIQYPLRLNMALSEGKSQKDYELGLEGLKTTGSKTVLSNANKLAEMPKASTSDFEFYINGKEMDSSGMAVKANKAVYLAGSKVAELAVELQAAAETEPTQCLDLTQAVNEINTLADKTADYILYLPGDYTDTNLTDGNPYGTFAMPSSGKAASMTVSGSKVSGEKNPTLTFSGGISANGNLTLEHLILEPVKGTSDRTAADFNISAAGNAKTGGALLVLDDVQTKADAKWNWGVQKLTTENQAETTGFINQISGTKNVTNVTIRNSELRLKTGVSNIDMLTLDEARLITCKASTFNDLSISDSTWDTLGATTITKITRFDGKDSYLAGKQDSKKYLPQLTVNGSVEGTVNLKVIAASNLLTEISYVDSVQDIELVKAPKASADRFRVLDEQSDMEIISYKDAAGYVRRGDLQNMKVKILDGGNSEEAGATYAKCWQDAVTIINTANEPKAVYTMELLQTGTILTGKEGTAYAGLTLPSKTAGVTIRGIREKEEKSSTILAYTGTLKPGCPVNFEDMVLTEGTLNKNVFTPTYQITLALGNVNVSFQNTATLKNPGAGAEEQKADLTVASASASKGILTLQDEVVYAKGNFVVPDLHVAGDVVLISDKTLTLTDITGENARLVLDAKMTAITRAGQQSLTQISIKGKIQGTEVGIAPQMYNLSRKAYHRMTAYEARALLAYEAKPDAGKKLANVSKTFADTEKIRLLYSYNETDWSVADKAAKDGSMDFYVYNSGLYVK